MKSHASHDCGCPALAFREHHKGPCNCPQPWKVSHVGKGARGGVALTLYNGLLNESSVWVIDPRFHQVSQRYDFSRATYDDAEAYAKLLEKQRSAR